MSEGTRRNFRIEAYKHRVVVDPKYAEKTWKLLDHAIQEIYNQNASGLSFEELYRNAYNMVLHKFGETLYSGLVLTLTSRLMELANSIEASPRCTYLEELNRHWTEHNKALQMIRDILMYMDRTFVPSTRKTPVYELGLNLWRDEVLFSVKIQARLKYTMMELVQLERNGDVINRGLMKNITKMLKNLGLTVYQEAFENPYLDESTDFYRLESQQLIENCDCGEYLKNAERRLNEEIDRVSHYMDSTTESKIIKVVEKEMVETHMQRLVRMENSGLISMFSDEKLEDLGRMYRLFSGVQNGLTLIKDDMTYHIRETGKDFISDPESLKDPLSFVQELLNRKERFDKIIGLSFNIDKTFQISLNSSFEYFINLNSRSPEFISLFMDDKLRNGLKKDEDDLETILDKVMILFRYLEEKDVFEKYYKQHLAKRLLSGKTASDDAERSLILRLKTECGYQFTSKLEGMLTDIKTSQDTMLGFQASLTGDARADQRTTFSVQVLTTGSWPTQPTPPCILPSEILTFCDSFKLYYLGAHSGRRLTWQTSMGHAILGARFRSVQKELSVSTYQMCVLMLFNKADVLSYKAIEQATEIPPSDLKRCLQSLACAKGKTVLRKSPMSRDVAEDDEFHFNDNFTAKLFRVKIGNVIAQKESESEKQETRQRVEEDRKPQIEAAIVRIMKARRVLDHNNMVAEVTKQLQPRFLPNPVVIKKRIESLIEREFLERDRVDRRLYRYIA